jgi:hypothetical protein
MKKQFSLTQFFPCREGLKYYNGKASFEEAWNECPRGDWMLWMADELDVDDRILTKAKALCANTIRHLMANRCSTDAIDAALRYADGGIGRTELDNFCFAAEKFVLFGVFNYPAYAANAAAATISALFPRAAAAVYASMAALDYADSLCLDFAQAQKNNQLQTADICREVLTLAVFEKVNEFQKKA